MACEGMPQVMKPEILDPRPLDRRIERRFDTGYRFPLEREHIRGFQIRPLPDLPEKPFQVFIGGDLPGLVRLGFGQIDKSAPDLLPFQ